MENTTKAGSISLPKMKILQTAALMIFALIVCRGPMMGGCYPLAISLIVYMLSRSIKNIYLIIPVAAGVLPCMTRGMDPWADMIAMCVCGLFFTAARRIRLQMWHRAVISAAIGIVCISIYRLATGTVYKTGVEMLLLEGMVIFAGVFVFRTFFMCMESRTEGFVKMQHEAAVVSVNGEEIRAASLLLVTMMVFNGAGLSTLVWPAVIFVSLWILVDLGAGHALISLAAGSVMAALMEQDQWGVAVTLFMAMAAAALVRKYGTLPVTALFAAACQSLSLVESGIVLGVDGRWLFISAALFLALRWKFGKGMGRMMRELTGNEEGSRSAEYDYAESIFQEKTTQINELAELYATYMDSRSVLSDQLGITAQILEDARWRLSKSGRRAARRSGEKFQVDVAISQCAATGVINGDCCGWQEIGDGRVAMVISDGMGKGKKAAAESLMVTKTLLSLLKAGATVELILKTINTIMLMKEDEDSYATVDLAIIDRNTSKARFYKIGAAPTLIRRKGNVEEVKLSAVPLGIVNGLKIRYVETTLKREDWVIMMSDGVSDGGIQRVGTAGSSDRGGFLYSLREAAANVRSKDPRTMSDLLLNRAADSYIGKERDDMTVMVAKII